MSVLPVISVFLLGGVLGWFFVPWVSNALLCRVQKREDAWRRKALDAHCVCKSVGSNNEVSGVVLETTGKRDISRNESRALYAIFLAAAFAAVTLISPNVSAAVFLEICVLAMAVSVVCDLRARVIPLEACALLAVAGAAFQLVACGLAGVVVGLGSALAIVAGSMLLNFLLGERCPAGAVGRGDVRCMGALASATGSGAFWGFAACYMLAGLVALAGCATEKLKLSDGIPMAPFLSVWLVCGVIASIA